jgi:hypothetical protein
MSDFASAINHELGVKPVYIPPAVTPQPVKAIAVVHSIGQRDTGKQEYTEYRGYKILVRQFGVTAIHPDPPKFGYWYIHFYTDEELRVEKAADNVEQRMQIAKKAVDRFFDNKPVYEGHWLRRKCVL